MTAAEAALESSGVPANRVHIEVFRSLDSDPFAAVVIDEDDGDEPPATAVVTLDGQTHEVAGRATRSCSTCCWTRDWTLRSPAAKDIAARARCVKKCGDVEMEINDVLEQPDLDEGLILACQAQPISDSVEVTYDE